MVNVPVHEILVLLANAQKPLSNAYTDISSRARCFNFGLSLHLHPYHEYMHLHLHPTFENASSEGSGKSAQLLAATFCLLIAFANSLDPNQDRQNVHSDLDPNSLTL